MHHRLPCLFHNAPPFFKANIPRAINRSATPFSDAIRNFPVKQRGARFGNRFSHQLPASGNECRCTDGLFQRRTQTCDGAALKTPFIRPITPARLIRRPAGCLRISLATNCEYNEVMCHERFSTALAHREGRVTSNDSTSIPTHETCFSIA